MHTGSEPKREPDANRARRKNLGVRKLERPGRPNPYGVQWREKIWSEAKNRLVSTPKTLFFPTAASRDAKYNEMLGLRRGRMLVHSVSREEMEEFRAFKAAIEGTPWQVVVAGWRENLVKSGRVPCALIVSDAAKLYLAAMLALRDAQPTPKLSAGSYSQKKSKVTSFAAEFGDLPLDAVSSEAIENWIDDFEEVESDFTFDSYRRIISAFYGYFIDNRTIRENPCKFIRERSQGIFEVKIISPEQTAQLFHTALTYTNAQGEKIFLNAIGRFALEAFIGLRFSSGCRIEKADINFVDKGVRLPRRKLKTGMVKGGRSHYIDELPAQLWDWLAITPEACWDITPRHYLTLKSALFAAANVPHPHNCLRHSFATYDMAANKNPGRTATILCHKDQEELWEHYNGIATSEAGKKYQRITPATAQELARGFAPAIAPLPSTPPAALQRLQA